jgi:TP53 regulating kinase-like protein/N6-L-threonylcarbamoyladenine synthase/protein kinase Bud32
MDMNVDMGAEAVVTYGEYIGRPAVIKTRPKKGYRHPELDQNLRTQRTKNEARTMREARMAGVRTPVIYDVDHHDGIITMERIFGRKVRDIIDDQDPDSDEVCRKIGESIAKLHNARICHGDLTTSNMIFTDSGELCIIDFSLGSIKCDVEGMGVDVRLLERAFTSAHSRSSDAFATIIDSYRKNMNMSKDVLKRVEVIKNRARYT